MKKIKVLLLVKNQTASTKQKPRIFVIHIERHIYIYYNMIYTYTCSINSSLSVPYI